MCKLSVLILLRYSLTIIVKLLLITVMFEASDSCIIEISILKVLKEVINLLRELKFATITAVLNNY